MSCKLFWIVIVGSLCFLQPGCSVTAKQYWKNRGHDVLDIIDYDFGAAPGVAAKVELTHFLVPSFGVGSGKEVRKLGRDVQSDVDGALASLLVLGVEVVSGDSLDVYVAGLRASAEGEAFKNSFRVGPNLYLGYLTAGLYLNLAQLVDFFGGLFGFDGMEDDAEPPPDDLVSEAWARNTEKAKLPFPEVHSTVFAIQHGKCEDGLLRYEKLLLDSYIRSRGPGDEVGLLWFDSFQTNRFPTGGALQVCDAAGKEALLTALSSIEVSAGSPILQGIPAAIELARSSSAPRKAVVLLLNGATNFTDGRGDQHFAAKAQELTALNAGNAEVHVVLYGDIFDPSVVQLLESLAAQNSGRLVHVAEKTLEWQP